MKSRQAIIKALKAETKNQCCPECGTNKVYLDTASDEQEVFQCIECGLMWGVSYEVTRTIVKRPRE